MHRLRCIITADCQLLFNQMYVKRDRSFFSLFHTRTLKEGRAGLLRSTSLMQHCGRWKPNCQRKLKPSKTQGFHSRVLPFCMPYEGAVSITAPQSFDALDLAWLMSGCTAPTDKLSIHSKMPPNLMFSVCNASDTYPTLVLQRLYLSSWDN